MLPIKCVDLLRIINIDPALLKNFEVYLDDEDGHNGWLVLKTKNDVSCSIYVEHLITIYEIHLVICPLCNNINSYA